MRVIPTCATGSPNSPAYTMGNDMYNGRLTDATMDAINPNRNESKALTWEVFGDIRLTLVCHERKLGDIQVSRAEACFAISQIKAPHSLKFIGKSESLYFGLFRFEPVSPFL